MIQGLTLPQLAQTIQEQHAMKRDFLVKSNTATFDVVGDGANRRPVLTFETPQGIVSGKMTDHAFRQLTEFAGIPAKYADKMSVELPDLLKENVQKWLTHLGKNRMVRAFQGKEDLVVRAFLSDSYKRVDNYDLFALIMPLLQAQHLKVLSSQVTESRLYIQAVNEELCAEIKRARARGGHTFVDINDTVSPGLTISNSEVGAGKTRIETLFYRKYCTNGCIIGDAISKFHIGARLGGDGDADAFELYSDETKQLTDAAFFSQIKDVIAGALDRAKFDKLVERISITTGIELPDATKAVELTQERFGLTESEKAAVFNNLIHEGESTLFGLFNAVTATANTHTDYDRAVELQRFGGQLLNVNADEVAKWTN